MEKFQIPCYTQCMKNKMVIIILLAALALTFGCSGKNESAAFSAGGGAMKAAYERAMPEPALRAEMQMSDDSRIREEEAGSEAAELNTVERKLVKRAYIRIRVENLAAADASITSMLQKYDAYAASTEVDENSRNYSLRVPALRYDTFLAEMNGMGRLLHHSENTEDVTLRYYDLEGRLATKRELLKTYQSYLGRARNIEEILSVEARIAELQNDIEGTGMQLRGLANRVDYATIELALLGPLSSVPQQSATLGERIKKLFGNFGAFLSTAAVGLVGVVIYGIPVLLLVIFFFWLLFGRIGLLKKLWRLAMAKKQDTGTTSST